MTKLQQKIAADARAPYAKKIMELESEIHALRVALELNAAVTDSFLNGQGAVTTDEMDEALTSACLALGNNPK